MGERRATNGWPSVAFGDVVRLSRERFADPEGGGLERYVGLEHLDPGELRVRRWGDLSEGTTFTNVFRAGQVLFGKRRAYQRKVAVADFDGVCSGDIYVLAARNERLLPELLPYICQSDGFFEHAVRTSAGSLSPRTNWESLASYELVLPPLEEQRRVVDLLVAGTRVCDRLQQLALTADALYRAAGVEHLARPGAAAVSPADWKRDGWNHEPLDAVVLSSAPICYGIVQVGGHDPAGVPTLAIKDLRGDFSTGIHRTAASIESRYARSRIEPADLLLSIKASIGEVAIVPQGFEGNISRDLARLRFDRNKIRPRYFFHLYRTPRYTQYVASLLVGSTRAELSIAALRAMVVPFPSLEEQDRLIDEMDAIVRAEESANARASEAFRLNREILEAALSQAGGRQ